MIVCYRCGGERCVKNGFMQGQQRDKCKECGDNFIDKPRRGHSQPVLALAVWLYLSDLSQRRIARLFGVSTPAVLKWIKTFALKNAPKPVPTGEGAAAVELDEMWHFLKKKACKIWCRRRSKSRPLGRSKTRPVGGRGVEPDAPRPPRRRWPGFRSQGGCGFQDAGVISPVSGSAVAAARSAGWASRRRLAFDCLSR